LSKSRDIILPLLIGIGAAISAAMVVTRYGTPGSDLLSPLAALVAILLGNVAVRLTGWCLDWKLSTVLQINGGLVFAALFRTGDTVLYDNWVWEQTLSSCWFVLLVGPPASYFLVSRIPKWWHRV